MTEDGDFLGCVNLTVQCCPSPLILTVVIERQFLRNQKRTACISEHCFIESTLAVFCTHSCALELMAERKKLFASSMIIPW